MQRPVGVHDLICPRHNEKIISAQLLESGETKLFCLKCFTGQIQIEQLSQQLNNQREDKIRRLTQQKQRSEKRSSLLKNIYIMIQDKFDQGINQIVQMIDEEQNNMMQQVNQQINSLTKSTQQITLTQVEQNIKEFKREAQNVDKDLYQDIDTQIRRKTIEQCSKLIRSLKDQFKELELLWKEKDQEPVGKVSKQEAIAVIQKQETIIQTSIQGQFELISEKAKTSCCWTMAMNKDDKILANGQDKNIQLWKYENTELTLKQTLMGHTICVRCLSFSKKSNWLISASDDKTLRIWKEQENGEWTIFQILEGHQHWVWNVILNDDEDQVISCSSDKTIKVWMKNTDGAEWECKQTLTELTTKVYQLSFNPSCNMLASCGNDRLRIWEKGIDKLWKQKHIVDEPKNDNYLRVCFINANELIATTDKLGRFYRLTANDNGQFLISQELLLNEISEPQVCFPIVYIRQLRMAICRHSDKYLYILIQQSSGEFLIHQVLIGQYMARHVSHDGRLLILQNYQTAQIEIWQMRTK